MDTRTLTRRLREHGTMRGWMFPSDMPLAEARARAATVDMKEEVFYRVAPSEAVALGTGHLTVLLVDAGAKDNLVRSLLERNARVIRAPWHADLAPLARQSDGILIGNGPGDPKDLRRLIEQVRSFLNDGSRPIFGVCLGNQILALAAGGDTYKLPYGHRGVNQPVQDLLTRRCYITSQNHGYAVSDDSLPAGLGAVVRQHQRWHERRHPLARRSRSSACSSIPRRIPGPADTGFLFDDFLRLVGAMKSR